MKKNISEIKKIREELKISTHQLARMCRVRHSSIRNIENNEVLQTVSLKSLEKLANAMDCEVVYNIVPKNKMKFNKIRDHLCQKAAKDLLIRVDHSMALENQKTYKAVTKDGINKLARKLKKENNPIMWQYVS